MELFEGAVQIDGIPLNLKGLIEKEFTTKHTNGFKLDSPIEMYIRPVSVFKPDTCTLFASIQSASKIDMEYFRLLSEKYQLVFEIWITYTNNQEAHYKIGYGNYMPLEVNYDN